jgi:hypothetical protein
VALSFPFWAEGVTLLRLGCVTPAGEATDHVPAPHVSECVAIKCTYAAGQAPYGVAVLGEARHVVAQVLQGS